MLSDDMVASARALDALKTIGLNKYERNLWVALLSRGSATAGELSDISNVPRSRCYDVLESLADRGFAVIQPGKPMKYVAMQPREALERAKKKIQEDSKETVEKIIRLAKSDVIKELEKIHRDNIKTVKPEELTGALKGRYAMLQHLESMLKKSKKSVKMMTTEAGLVELSEHHFQYLKKASDSGVKIQLVAPITKQNAGVAKDLSKFASVRDISNMEHVEKLLGRMTIIDGQEFIIGLTDDVKVHPTQDVAIWSQSSHVAANTIEPMFDLVWKFAKPVEKK